MNLPPDNDYDHHRGRQPLLRPAGAVRTWLFLGVTIGGFLVINAFWLYLATGNWADFSISSYRRDLAAPLGGILMHPLNIFSHPWMISVIGLLLGVVVFVPVIVAVLYRMAIAAIFVVIVALVGHAPVLSLASAVGCVVAARTPLRSDMPFLAAVLGFLPAGAYLYFSATAGSDSAGLEPLQKLVQMAPFLIAMVSAVLASAAVLALARLTGFRPGVVWPVLAAMLAGPLIIFILKIGRAELRYNLIANHLGGGVIFESISLDAWRKQYADGLPRQAIPNRLNEYLESNKRALAAGCDRFLARYGESDRAAAVAWIKAQCLSLQYDSGALEIGLIKFISDPPSEASQPAWLDLAERYRGSPQAALAQWRLAQIAIHKAAGAPADSREELLDRAQTLLAEARSRLETITKLVAEPAESEGAFRPAEPVPAVSHYGEALMSVSRLLSAGRGSWAPASSTAPAD